MIRHTVMFNLKHAPGSLQEKGFLRDARMLATLPGVENFEVVRQVGDAGRFRFGLTMEFADQTTFNGYATHPKHAKFLRDRWDREVADYLEFDSEPV